MSVRLITVLFFYVVLCFSLLFATSFSAVAAAPDSFSHEVVASGFTRTTSAAFLPDGRVLVAEKTGEVKIVENGIILPTPLIDLPNVNSHGDRGLLGLAVDPNFETNGYIYLAYTYENNPADVTGPKTAQVIRLTVSGNTADYDSRVVLLGSVVGSPNQPSCDYFSVTADCIPSDSASHSVGALRFSPEGYLFAVTGDGAGFFEVEEQAQRSLNLNSLAGKLLRINTDGTAVTDNPFFTGNPNDNRSKVFAYGIRNSFKYNVRPSNGSVYLGDVGWDTWEEVNVATGGENFGWPCREGFNPQARYQCETEKYTDPIYVYPHPQGQSSAIAGGAFGGEYYPAEFQGNYFFSDVVAGVIHRMVLDESDTPILIDEEFLPGADGPVEFITGPDGAIYYLSIFTGELRKIAYRADQDPNPEPSNEPDPQYLSSSFLPQEFVVGELVEIRTQTQNIGTNEPYLTTVEFYDAQGQYAGGSTIVNSGVTTGAIEELVFEWTPTAPGSYIMQIGYFSPDWATEYGWQGAIQVPTVLGDSEVPTEADPTHVASTHDGGDHPVFARPINITSTVRNDGSNSPIIAGIEIYDENEELEYASYSGATTIANGETTNFANEWFPSKAGIFTVHIGLFSSQWNLYEWTPDILTIEVFDRTPEPSPDPNGPPAPEFVSSTFLTQEFVVGTPIEVRTRSRNLGGNTPYLTTVEFYNEQAEYAGGNTIVNTGVETGQIDELVFEWTPEQQGNYLMQFGYFSPDWSVEYGWEKDIVVPTIQAETGVPLDADPTHVSSTHDGDSRPNTTSAINITSTIRNDGADSPFIAGIEIYDENGELEYSSYSDEITVANSGTIDLVNQWPPSKPGVFTVHMGIFTPHWGKMYEWTPDILIIEVYDNTPTN